MICDTSVLIAAHVGAQHHHEECLAALNSAPGLVISPLVLAELDYLVSTKHGTKNSLRILRALAGPEYELAPFGISDFASAIDIMTAYSDLGIGLTDASLVVLAKRYKTNEILTLDQRRFRAIRGLDGRHFKLLPFDAD